MKKPSTIVGITTYNNDIHYIAETIRIVNKLKRTDVFYNETDLWIFSTWDDDIPPYFMKCDIPSIGTKTQFVLKCANPTPSHGDVMFLLSIHCALE